MSKDRPAKAQQTDQSSRLAATETLLAHVANDRDRVERERDELSALAVETQLAAIRALPRTTACEITNRLQQFIGGNDAYVKWTDLRAILNDKTTA